MAAAIDVWHLYVAAVTVVKAFPIMLSSLLKVHNIVLTVLILFTVFYTLDYLVSRPIIVLHPSSQIINLNQTATFKCNATGYNSSIRWTIKSGSFPRKVTGVNSNILVIPGVRASDANTYTCVASNQAGMASSYAKLTVAGMISIDILGLYYHVQFSLYHTVLRM